VRKRVFFMTHLREGKSPEEYERFLREVDYPLTLELLPVSYYRATRLEGDLSSPDGASYSYIEVLDIEDWEAYTQAFASPSPEVADLIQQVFSFVDDRSYLAPFGEVVE
jgi:hypothetical protein